MAKHFNEDERQKITSTLFEVGHEEFSKRGLRAARIEDICRAAGISKGSFYNFFPAKEMLFLAIIEQREIIHRQKLTDLADTFDGAEADLIDQLFDITLTAIQTDPFIAMMQQPGELEYLGRKVGPEQMESHQSGDFAFFAELTMSLQKTGYFKTASKDALAEIAVLIFCTTMQSEMLPPDTLAAALSQLRDLMHFKLTTRGA